MNIRGLIKEYIDSKELSWSPSTLKSESNRLLSIADLILPPCPENMWRELNPRLSPYSRLTAWVRLIDFYDWLLETGKESGRNVFADFKRKNRRLFKHVYERRVPTISYAQANEKIQTISDPAIRGKAMELLSCGLRYTESNNKRDGGVCGKGNKWRPLYGKCAAEPSEVCDVSYNKVWKALREIGLKPHDLRKIAATHFYSLGLSEIDLCRVMGWESFETAKSYIAPKKDEELRSLLNGTK